MDGTISASRHREILLESRLVGTGTGTGTETSDAIPLLGESIGLN